MKKNQERKKESASWKNIGISFRKP